MFKRISKLFLCVFAISLLQACVTLANERLVLKQDTFVDNYPRIKQIVVEEAANNGFGTLTSEVKPSQFNGWKGKFFFSLVTPNGTDQLFVEFEKKDEGIAVHIHGGGTRTNPDSASKAIAARLGQL